MRAWKRAWLLVGSLVLAAVVLVCINAPARAQDPVGGALATLAAATARAEQVRAAQRATAQAQSAQATQAALDAVSTRQAIDATAAAGAVYATSTAQAQSAMATGQAQAAVATRQAIDAEATRAAYDVGLWLLYAVAAVCFVGCAYVVIAWARRATAGGMAVGAAPASDAGAVDGVVVDVGPAAQLLLPGPGGRMGGGFTVVDDPRVVSKFREFVDQNAVQRSDPCQQE